MLIQTNWCVITGGPSSGKTTLINMLAAAGHQTVPEVPRRYIDEQLAAGVTIAELRQDEGAFQRDVARRVISEFGQLSPQQLLFSDRGLHDCVAYLRFCRLSIPDELAAAVEWIIYKRVFLLDLLPYVTDYARTETAAEQQQLHALLHEVYQPFDLVVVPVLPPAERLAYILERV